LRINPGEQFTKESEAMNRLLACTAVGLFLGLAPALAETQLPAPDQQDQPALDQPAQPSEAMPAEPATPDAAMPANPGASNEEPAETPGQSSEMAPEASPSDQASPPALGEAAPSDQASPPAVGEAAPSDQASPPALGEAEPPPASSEAPKSAEASPSSGGAFLAKQDSSDWLVGNLIGKSVVNADNESIGDVNDLVTDQNGKIIAIVVGAGGFLGIGEKDVAIRFEDVKLARDENNDVKVIADLNKETLASAPDFETLDEQQITVGEGGDQDTAK
jgi:sporulation protein YlmC with PRC-barrel domain